MRMIIPQISISQAGEPVAVEGLGGEERCRELGLRGGNGPVERLVMAGKPNTGANRDTS
jgi:hypothetical protein